MDNPKNEFPNKKNKIKDDLTIEKDFIKSLILETTAAENHISPTNSDDTSDEELNPPFEDEIKIHASDDEKYESLKSDLHYPPNTIIFDYIPEYLRAPYPHIKYAFFGAVMVEGVKQSRNQVNVPFLYHKLFLIHLLAPPQYEDIKKQLVKGSFTTTHNINYELECFYRLKMEYKERQDYIDFVEMCMRFGIALIEEINMHPATCSIDLLSKHSTV